MKRLGDSIAYKFLQKAIRHKGRVHEDLMRLYGHQAFNEDGTIKAEYLNKAEEHARREHNISLERAIILAKRLKSGEFRHAYA